MEEQMMEQLLDSYSKAFSLSPALSIIGLALTALCILYMHYAAQYRNQKLGMGWYICGIIFGPLAVLIFVLKKKSFPGPDLKVCPSCGNRCPLSYEVCNRCLVELPEVDEQEKTKQKKLSKIFGIGVIVTFILDTVLGMVMMGTVTSEVIDIFKSLDFSENYKIAVDGVYYDKKGNSYEKETDVPLYDKDGRVYTYTTEMAGEDIYSYEEEYYVRDDGEKYFAYDCYVTEEGFFYCDKAYVLDYYYPDTDKMTEEEIDAYYQLQVNQEGDGYRYYYEYLVDEDGNKYFEAYEASWNEKGELITEANDPTLNVVEDASTKAVTE